MAEAKEARGQHTDFAGVPVSELQIRSLRPLGLESLSADFETDIEISETGEAHVLGHVGVRKQGVRLKVSLSLASEPASEAVELLRERLNRDLATALEVPPKDSAPTIGVHVEEETDNG